MLTTRQNPPSPMSSCRLPFAVFAVLAVLAAPLHSQEWTRFRGPNGQGHSDAGDSIPVEWTENDYNWKVELPGIGHSSPVLWGGKIFLTSADPKTGTRHVLCLSAADGSKLWQRDFEAATHHVHTRNSFSSSTPALDAQRVYVAWATPEEYTLLALDHEGQDVWRVNLGPFKSEHGFGTSPIVVDDKVIITGDHEGEDRFVVAVDAKTGQQRWRIPRGFADNWQNASYSTPCIMDTADWGRVLICSSWAHGVSAHDLETGKPLWEKNEFNLRPVSSPVFAGGLILASCGESSGRNTVVAIRPGTKQAEPELVFKLGKRHSPYVPTMCVVDDLAFLWHDAGKLTCIDAQTGEVHYMKRIGGNFFGSPICVGDRLYCISADGETVVIKASKEFEVLARNPLGESSHATPAVADGKMYLRTLSHLMSIGGK